MRAGHNDITVLISFCILSSVFKFFLQAMTGLCELNRYWTNRGILYAWGRIQFNISNVKSNHYNLNYWIWFLLEFLLRNVWGQSYPDDDSAKPEVSKLFKTGSEVKIPAFREIQSLSQLLHSAVVLQKQHAQPMSQFSWMCPQKHCVCGHYSFSFT